MNKIDNIKTNLSNKVDYISTIWSRSIDYIKDVTKYKTSPLILKRYRYNLEKRDELIEFLKSEKGIQQLKNTEGFISFEYYETMCLSILDSEEIYTIVTLQKWRSIENYEENLKKNNIDGIFDFTETLILNYNPIN
tara:strand:- start:41 stop:448 length:408 start_codon:yes stop_codon:yes gene_type:complete